MQLAISSVSETIQLEMAKSVEHL